MPCRTAQQSVLPYPLGAPSTGAVTLWTHKPARIPLISQQLSVHASKVGSFCLVGAAHPQSPRSGCSSLLPQGQAGGVVRCAPCKQSRHCNLTEGFCMRAHARQLLSECRAQTG